MCWEHENEYSEVCFDFLWEDYGLFDDECIVNLLKGMDIYFKDHETSMKAKWEFFDLLTKWHDEGLIKPSE